MGSMEFVDSMGIMEIVKSANAKEFVSPIPKWDIPEWDIPKCSIPRWDIPTMR